MKEFEIEENTLIRYTGKKANVIIPYGIKIIKENAFKDCKFLKSVKIPESVTNIGYCVFENCISLKSIYVPDSVTSIGAFAFSGCTALKSVSLSNSLTLMRHGMFRECYGLENIEIPSSVTQIEGLVFCQTNLKHIKIPNFVEFIYDTVFCHCHNLQSVILPDSITQIYSRTFWDCTSLESIDIPPNVKAIGESAFEYCEKLKRINFPKSITSISENAFRNTKWLADYPNDFVVVNGILIKYKGNEENIIIPDTVTQIAKGFYDKYSTKTISIELPDTVTSIAQELFKNMKNIKSIKIPSSVKSIGTNAFKGCDNIVIYYDDIEIDVKKLDNKGNLYFIFKLLIEKDFSIDWCDKRIKYPIILKYFIEENNSDCQKYLQNNILKVFKYYALQKNESVMLQIFPHIIEFINKQNINKLLQYAVLNNLPQTAKKLKSIKNNLKQ